MVGGVAIAAVLSDLDDTVKRKEQHKNGTS